MDPREFLKLAGRLTGNSSPANNRTAISRAYYAAHLVTKNFLSDVIGLNIVKSGHAHGIVAKYMGNCDDIELDKLEKQLGDLQGMRIDADYEMELSNVELNIVAIFQKKVVERIFINTNDISQLINSSYGYCDIIYCRLNLLCLRANHW
jgi:hypothetical protein